MGQIKAIREPQRVLVVIPTRNRFHLTVNAIRSVLALQARHINVLVSDNSTSEHELAECRRFCELLGDERLQYVNPPKPLAMASHWDWAIQYGCSKFDPSHLIFLTDRMIFKPDHLKELLDIVACYPDRIVSYTYDRVVDDVSPVEIQPAAWTGNLFEIQASRLLLLSSQCSLHESLPRLLNCAVPRQLVSEILKRFGTVCDSLAPDFTFCYRALEIVDAILYYDKALLVHYALDRSNGMSTLKGVINDDHADFLAGIGETLINSAAPIPGLDTVHNTVMHEYCRVQRASQTSKLPAVDMTRYLDVLACEVESFQDPQLALTVKAALVAHGWTERKADLPAEVRDVDPLLARLRRIPRGAVRRIGRLLSAPPAENPEVDQPEAAPETTPNFDSSQAAIDHIIAFPRQRSERFPWLENLLEPEIVRAPPAE